MILNEIQLVENLIESRFSQNKVWTEVPNMGQSVDIVVGEEDALMFIEVKIKNWSRAFEQCLAHEIVADYICIAVATKNISDKMFEHAKEKGYGILHFIWDTGSWNYALKPTRNSTIWKPQQEILKGKLKEMEYA